MSETNPPLYCTNTLIAMKGHKTKTKTKDTISLDYSSLCYIASRIGLVSMKGIYKYSIDVDRRDTGKCPITLVVGNLLVYSTIQCSTVVIILYVCVCVFSSHSFWTSSSLDVPAGVTQEEGHTGFLIHLLSAVRALIFLARRIQPFLSLVDREVELCVLTI